MLVSKSFNQNLIAILVSSIFLIGLLFTILMNAFKDGKFTCNKYILNTYLYIILTINLMTLGFLSLEYYQINYFLTLPLLVLIFLLNIGLIFLLKSVDPEKVILKHLLWLLFVMVMIIIVYPIYFYNDKKIIISAFMTTLLITIALTGIAFAKPEWISLSIGPILFFGLLSIILMELFLLFVFRNKLGEKKWLFRAISYAVIFIFMGFILYDTKRLQINAKECVKADYINESMKIFLDILNIFVRIVGLKSRLK